MEPVRVRQAQLLSPEDARERSRLISLELRRVARKARASRSTVRGGFRPRRSDKLFRGFLISSFLTIFLVPFVAACVYFGYLASNQYISEARFSVRSGEGSGVLAGLSDLVGLGQGKDALVVADYIESRALLDALQDKLDVRGMFSRDDADYLARLNSDAPAEKFLKYWKNKVDISVDRNSGLATLKVRAFSPADSLTLTSAILGMSEALANDLTRRNEQDALADSKEELERAKNKLEVAIANLRDERNKAGVLDVAVTAKAYGQIVTALRLELSKIELSIDSLKRNNAQNSPQLATLTNHASSLQEQIRSYEDAMASQSTASPNDSNETLAERATLLQGKEIELNIAQLEYQSATTEYEKARLVAERQRAYLLTYVAPRLAEESLYPRRLLMITVFGVVGFLAWSIAAGIALLVRDHMAP